MQFHENFLVIFDFTSFFASTFLNFLVRCVMFEDSFETEVEIPTDHLLLSVIFENLFQTQHGTPGGHICSVVIISVDRRKIEKCAKIVVTAVRIIVEKNLK